MTILVNYYPNMKTFFVGFLGVKALTLQMIYDELKRKGSSATATVKEVKEMLWQLNSFLTPEGQAPNPEPLLQQRILPVRYPGGEITLCSNETAFEVVDRKNLGDAFGDKVKLLDFSLSEARKLEPFLQWAGLESRYLSRTVEEVTSLRSATRAPISSPERDIKRKAYALYR